MTLYRLAMFAIVIAIASLSLQSPQLPAKDDTITVGTNVQVSAAMPTTMHGEGMIAADPTDPRRLIICSVFLTEDAGQSVAVYRSDDRGAHWERAFETPLDEMTVDPACTFGSDGVAYLTMLPVSLGSMAVTRLSLLRSEDGGRTWTAGGVTGGMDRPSIAIDGTRGRFSHRIYLHGGVDQIGNGGVRRPALTLYASADGGRTFGRPVSWAPFGREYMFAAGNGAVLSDGRWVAVFVEMKDHFASPTSVEASPFFAPPPEPENASIKVIASDDGGNTLREPSTVSGAHVPNQYVRMTTVVPALASDATNGPFKDRLYVAWADSRSSGSDILFSYSADRGATWSAPAAVNDDRRPPGGAANHLMPAIAVNREGIVAITWLDRRNATEGLGWEERIRVSTDGGETFLPSAAVSQAQARFGLNESWPALAGTTGGGTPVYGGGLLHLTINAPRFLYIPGDYATLAAGADAVFHPYWIDNRTGWHQVWTAAVRVAGEAVRNGSSALSGLDDLTTLTTLRRVAAHYDRNATTASVTVRLENTSDKPLDGPFTVRLITLNSDIADVTVMRAANGATRAGATWIVPERRLEPDAVSAPLTLTFGLTNVRSFIQGHTDHFDFRLVKFDVRVLGHLVKTPDESVR